MRNLNKTSRFVIYILPFIVIVLLILALIGQSIAFGKTKLLITKTENNIANIKDILSDDNKLYDDNSSFLNNFLNNKLEVGTSFNNYWNYEFLLLNKNTDNLIDVMSILDKKQSSDGIDLSEPMTCKYDAKHNFSDGKPLEITLLFIESCNFENDNFDSSNVDFPQSIIDSAARPEISDSSERLRIMKESDIGFAKTDAVTSNIKIEKLGKTSVLEITITFTGENQIFDLNSLPLNWFSDCARIIIQA